MQSKSNIVAQISSAISAPFDIEQTSAIGGGCINRSYKIEGYGKSYFIKINEARHFEMFNAEQSGLQELSQASAVRVPEPICAGHDEYTAWLVLEYVPMGRAGGSGMRDLGIALAQQHRVTADKFGWHRDNTIGSTPQINTQSDDWIDFWRTQRLEYQLRLAAENGYGGKLQRKGEVLLADAHLFFRTYHPRPSLLHGDLWSGNIGYDPNGKPVIFDPAIYYGDREADVAMTELFGGFAKDFYLAYDEAFALDADYRVRKIFYNLYHILNHLNLFGGSYLRQAEGMVEQLLAELS